METEYTKSFPLKSFDIYIQIKFGPINKQILLHGMSYILSTTVHHSKKPFPTVYFPDKIHSVSSSSVLYLLCALSASMHTVCSHLTFQKERVAGDLLLRGEVRGVKSHVFCVLQPNETLNMARGRRKEVGKGVS